MSGKVRQTLVISALVSSTNKTDGHGIAEILLKLALNTITLTPAETEIVKVILSSLVMLKGLASSL
jgi:hypothetical protein